MIKYHYNIINIFNIIKITINYNNFILHRMNLNLK